jgi:hypothetical protein
MYQESDMPRDKAEAEHRSPNMNKCSSIANVWIDFLNKWTVISWSIHMGYPMAIHGTHRWICHGYAGGYFIKYPIGYHVGYVIGYPMGVLLDIL